MNNNFTPTVLSPREALSYLQEKAALVDIRPEYETSYRNFDVPKVYYVPYSSYIDSFHILPKDTLLIVADSVGNQSMEVARFLLMQGYPEVACLAGGVVEWDRNGLPLAKDTEYEMVGGCACKLQPNYTKPIKEQCFSIYFLIVSILLDGGVPFSTVPRYFLTSPKIPSSSSYSPSISAFRSVSIKQANSNLYRPTAFIAFLAAP